MSDVRYLSKKFIKEFIDLYKSLPSLWNLKCKHYYDRSKKNSDYEVMVKKLSEVEPEATREMVTQKINSMRGSRRKEMAKIKQSIEAGGDVYEPKLWYFKFMDFVDAQESPQAPGEEKAEGKDNENASSPEFQVDTDTGSVTIVTQDLPSVSSSNSVPKRALSEDDVPSTPVVAFTTRAIPKRHKRKRKPTKDTNTEENHEAFGRYVAYKLGNLAFEQRVYLEKIINEAIFEAELGNLNRNCYVYVPAPSDSE